MNRASSSDSKEERILAPLIISDIAIDVRTEAFKLELFRIGKPANSDTIDVGSRVMVEFIWSQDEFARLTKACPVFDPEIFDENASVVICKRDAQRLGIFHGSVLVLKPLASLKGSRSELGQIEPKPSSSKKVKLALALVTDCVQSERPDDVAVVKMLPVLWFNLCRMASDSSSNGLDFSQTRQCFLSRLQQQPQPANVMNSSSLPLPMPYANEVIVSTISSPQYNNAMSCDFLLKFYFSKQRLLQEGDVFAVHSIVDPRLFESIPEGSDVRHPVVYFKVKKLRTSEKRSPGACLVDRNHSELLQESSIHGYIPSEMLYFYSATLPLSDSYHRLQPVFSEHISYLLDIFRPFISNRRRCRDLYPIVLLSGPIGSRLICLSRMLAAQLNMHHYRMNCSHLVTDTAATSEAKINQYVQIVGAYSPCVLLLDAVELLGKDRDGHEDSRVASYFVSALKKLIDDSSDLPVIVIATTSAAAQISSDINQCFLHCLSVEVPKESERLEILRSLLSDEPLASNVSLSHLAQRSAGMVLDDFIMMLSYVKQSAYHRISTHRSCEVSDDDLPADVKLIQEDFESALNRMQSMHSESIGAPKIPNVTWDDVGGLANVKKDILDTIQLPLQHPQLLSLGLRRSGILLYGPPGTGKTLLAKAVATECSLNFLSVKGPELLNMYVGQSEENIRHVFERARAATPCVIFFDELDSLAPNRGRSGDSGGVMDRVVSQLLAELDGLHKSNSVFVIGATNRPDLLDPALLRPGRFDKLVYLGVSEDRESQLKILKALTRKFDLSPGVQLENVVKKCPLNLTGADFYALSADAMLNAIHRKIDELGVGGTAQGATDSVKLEVSEEDFLFALNNLIPSLSDVELNRYKSLQSHYANPSKAIT